MGTDMFVFFLILIVKFVLILHSTGIWTKRGHFAARHRFFVVLTYSPRFNLYRAAACNVKCYHQNKLANRDLSTEKSKLFLQN